jgi:hypothetical protein
VHNNPFFGIDHNRASSKDGNKIVVVKEGKTKAKPSKKLSTKKA